MTIGKEKTITTPGFSCLGPLDKILPESLLAEGAVTPRPQEVPGSDRFWMTEALIESLKNIGLTNPNPAVGCILVDTNGNEISRGATQPFPGKHAERIALENVQEGEKGRLQGATAYVTLEPCSHFGRNPPCVDLLTQSPIQRVVIAISDPNEVVNGEGIQRLRKAGKEVELGVLAEEATGLNLSFLANIVLRRPVFVFKWAQTLDGQLADDSGTSKWITGPVARGYAHWLRQRYDVILVGARTLINDYPGLDVRNCLAANPRDPLPVIFDPKGITFDVATDVQEALKQTTFKEGRRCVLVTSANAMERYRKSWLHAVHGSHPVSVVAMREGMELIPRLVQVLADTGSEVANALGRPLQSVFVEGGSQTLTHFLAAGYADILHTFIAPVLSGGKLNRVRAGRLLKDAHRFSLVSTTRLGADVLMEMTSHEIMEKLQRRTSDAAVECPSLKK